MEIPRFRQEIPRFQSAQKPQSLNMRISSGQTYRPYICADADAFRCFGPQMFTDTDGYRCFGPQMFSDVNVCRCLRLTDAYDTYGQNIYMLCETLLLSPPTFVLYYELSILYGLFSLNFPFLSLSLIFSFKRRPDLRVALALSAQLSSVLLLTASISKLAHLDLSLLWNPTDITTMRTTITRTAMLWATSTLVACSHKCCLTIW